MGLYTEPRTMWRKKLSYERILDVFKKFYTKDYHDLRELQRINTTQVGFCGANMAIKMQYYIYEALDNLSMTTTSKNVLTQINSTIKHLA